MISITIDEKALKTARELFADSPKVVRIAAAKAINRANTAVQKEVSKAIRKNYEISAKNIKKGFKLKRATAGQPIGAVISRGAPTLITRFKLKPDPTKMMAALRSGAIAGKSVGPISVKVKKGSSFVPVRGLFIQKSSRSGYAGAMQRYVKSAYPLHIPYGPSVPQMFGNEETLAELIPIAEEVLNDRFLHEITVRYVKGIK